MASFCIRNEKLVLTESYKGDHRLVELEYIWEISDYNLPGSLGDKFQLALYDEKWKLAALSEAFGIVGRPEEDWKTNIEAIQTKDVDRKSKTEIVLMNEQLK